MKSGRRDTLAKFSRPGAGIDDFGHPSGAPLPLGTAYAAVFYGSGTERREAGGSNASQVATFEVLANATTRALRVDDTLEARGLVWNIRALVPLGREAIAITGVAAR